MNSPCRHLALLLFLLSLLYPNSLAALSSIESVRWKNVVQRMPDEWYGSKRALIIANNVQLYQRCTGGWPKNIQMHHAISDSLRSVILAQKMRIDDSTIDDGATRLEIIYLAKVYMATGDSACRAAFLRGIDYLLEAQYDNGGWPQIYPPKKDYSANITYNDNAMISVMRLLRALIYRKDLQGLLTEQYRLHCAEALSKGVACILNAQYVQNGVPTVWCAQHDPVTLQPAKGRAYELPSLSGAESVRIIQFLQTLPEPSDEVVQAIKYAIEWFDKVRLEGIRLEQFNDELGRRDLRVIEDVNASSIWARFYSLDENTPLFCDRDGVKRNSLAQLSYERRNGYGWYTTLPQSLFKRSKQ